MPGPSFDVLLGLAFSAGTATFFAPCAFPLLPGYLSYFLGDSASVERGDGESLVAGLRWPLARGAVTGLLAAAGVMAVYVALAGVAIGLGGRALADIAVMELVVGAVFLVSGAAMAAGWEPSRQLVRLPERRRSLAGFFVFGALYAVAAAGCTAPLFVAVVAKGIAVGPLHGVGLAVAYAAGTGALMVGLTTVAAVGGQSVLRRLTDRTAVVYRVAGALLAVSGVAEIYYYLYGFPKGVTV